jgi:hypothetical protein
MGSDDYAEEREALLRTVERDEHELREAVGDLKRAVTRPLEIVEEITSSPIPWLFCAALLGIWLGARREGDVT